MTTETPPNAWLLIEAAKQTRIRDAEIEWLRALCDMVAKHEKPTEDRRVLCAREALSEASIAYPDVVWTGEDVGLRAIELWEEGFGK
jgi:hypothetical protein